MEKDVLCFEVSVQNGLGVHILDGNHNLGEYVQKLRLREGRFPSSQQLVEVPCFAVVCNDAEVVLVHEVVDVAEGEERCIGGGEIGGKGLASVGGYCRGGLKKGGRREKCEQKLTGNYSEVHVCYTGDALLQFYQGGVEVGVEGIVRADCCRYAGRWHVTLQ